MASPSSTPGEPLHPPLSYRTWTVISPLQLGGYFGNDWDLMHEGEAIFSNPFRIADFPFPFLFKLQNWGKPTFGNALVKTYDRFDQSGFIRERTTIELRIAP